jgi:general secretion pathway protein F/MSHA biogenesis protein MshG
MVKAGISLKDSLEDIGQYTEDETVKEIFLKAAEAIDSGKTLSSVFEEYEAYIGGVSVAMIRLGEQTGDIVMALDNLARIYEKMADNRKRMVKALRYPVITLFAIAGAFTFLVLFVVPKFKAIFAELHADLPLPTKILLGAEYLLSHYGWAVALGLVGLVIFHSFMYKTSKKYKYRADQVALRTYLIKDVILYGSLQRFLMVLGTLVKSGIPLIDALKISQGIMGNSVLQEKITFIIRGINQGRGLGEMLREVDLLDFIALKMVEAGEKSGELDTMLQKASNYYDDKFDAVVDNMQAAIEPIMMLVIGGLVLLIALGVFLPMWNLGQAVKHG